MEATELESQFFETETEEIAKRQHSALQLNFASCHPWVRLAHARYASVHDRLR